MSNTNPNATKEIDKAFEALDGFRQKYCKHLRTLIHKALPETAEDWRGKALFSLNDNSLCGIYTTRTHVKLVFFKGSIMKDTYDFFDDGDDASGSRSINFTEASIIDDNKITEYLQEAAEINKQTVKSEKKGMEIPADLIKALGINSGVKMYFERLAPSHKREYIEYLADAKASDTRERRIKKVVEMVTESKKLHEKYANRKSRK